MGYFHDLDISVDRRGIVKSLLTFDCCICYDVYLDASFSCPGFVGRTIQGGTPPVSSAAPADVMADFFRPAGIMATLIINKSMQDGTVMGDGVHDHLFVANNNNSALDS